MTLGFDTLFLGALVGQAFAGHADMNNKRAQRRPRRGRTGRPQYLRFFLFVMATI